MSIAPDEWQILLRLAAEVCTERELEVMHWWSRGCGITRTADALDLSRTTVRCYRRRALQKIRQRVAA